MAALHSSGRSAADQKFARALPCARTLRAPCPCTCSPGIPHAARNELVVSTRGASTKYRHWFSPSTECGLVKPGWHYHARWAPTSGVRANLPAPPVMASKAAFCCRQAVLKQSKYGWRVPDVLPLAFHRWTPYFTAPTRQPWARFDCAKGCRLQTIQSYANTEIGLREKSEQ
jgi:hypothetical protein